MREKIVKFLFTPIPGTKRIEQGLFRVICMSSTKLRQWSVSSLIFLLKSLRWFVPSLSILLAIWMIGGNFLASQQEKEIKQDIDAFVERFPDTEPNDSALKLRALMAKLGISGDGATEFPIDAYTLSHPDFAVSPSGRQAFDEIREELGDYLDAQISKPNDNVDPIPDKLKKYLIENEEDIEAISQHILNNEVPRWERHIPPTWKGNPIFALPSHLNLVDLQRIITLYILVKNSRAQSQEAKKMLEVSWKINQSIRNEYYFITLIVARMSGTYTTGVLRKFDYLPVEWQQRLLKDDYQELFVNSLQGEFFGQFKLMQNLYLYPSDVWGEHIFLLRLLKLPILKPYRSFSAIDTYNWQKQFLAGYNQYNICLSDSAAINARPAWWNRPGQIISNYVIFLRKESQYRLDLELTQKILQVKELAAKTGKWPQSVPNMESEICPGVKWVYQVSPDGTTMSISLSEQPEWLTERIENNSALPLTYSTRRIPDYDQSLN